MEIMGKEMTETSFNIIVQNNTIKYKTLFNDFDVKMPEPQYLGCKYKILP